MSQVSQRVQKMSFSATLAMTQKARELKAKGHDVISLSIGEPDFNPPEFIQEAAITAIKEGFNSYTPVPGYAELREAISNKFKRDNNLDYSTEQIVVSNGAKQSITNVFLATLNEGDEVIVPAPYWVSYIEMIKIADGIPVTVETSIENDFKITPEQLKSKITTKTKGFIFSSPCNPSGSLYSKEELQALVNILKDYPHITIISDEIYEHINYTGQHTSIAQFSEVKEQTVTVNGMSKAFAMTGWRIGYIGAPLWLAKACNKVQGQMTSGANSVAQRASIKGLEAPISEIQYMIDAFKTRRSLVLDLAKDINGFQCNEPEGAFYIFPDVSTLFGKTFNGVTINTSTDLAMYLLEHAHVGTVSGDAFGSPNCLRISYAASETQLKEAFKRIKNALI
ncbi:aspartate transaminase [Flavobacteriaceae bacterium UJ101]|nr:aspartate transaminase [Flavobacteriaceae bacterium UJ101]